MKKRILTIFMSILTVTLIGQNVSGTIGGSDGEKLIGTTVFVIGTNIGTSTDIDGHFSFTVEPGMYSFTASYVT
jgi:hypothetical protein